MKKIVINNKLININKEFVNYNLNYSIISSFDEYVWILYYLKIVKIYFLLINE